MPRLQIEVNEAGHGRVLLDDQDISHDLRKIEITVQAGGYTQVWLYFVRSTISANLVLEPSNILTIHPYEDIEREP